MHQGTTGLQLKTEAMLTTLMDCGELGCLSKTRFVSAVLPRRTRINLDRVSANVLEPTMSCPRKELWAVIASYEFDLSIAREPLTENLRRMLTSHKTGPDCQSKGLSIVFIQN